MLAQERPQRVEVARRAALADQDAHAERGLVARLVKREALVVGLDAAREVGAGLLPAESGRMAVHALAARLRGGDLRKHLRVARDGPGPVHHLAQVADAGVVEEPRAGIRVEHGARGLEASGRHARRASEPARERRARNVLEHVAHARLTQDVGDLVRIAHARHRAVAHGNACEFPRRQHAALHVHVGVDEAGHEDARIHRAGRRHDGRDAPLAHGHGAWANNPGHDVRDLVMEDGLCHARSLAATRTDPADARCIRHA